VETQQATMLLKRLDGGDASAADELYPMLYDELLRVARGIMGGERVGHTLQPTALVHEAWLRLVDDSVGDVQGRNHFLSIASRVMRRILVDHARKKGAAKRGGEQERLPLDAVDHLASETGVDVLTLDEALDDLTTLDPQLGRVVELRFFGGLTNEEVAGVEQTSLRSVERAWSTARAWLAGRLAEAS
jgi:RNA polymerase sigma-70 factor (ECF subfamily)